MRKIKFRTQSPIYNYKDIYKVLDMSLNESMLVSKGKTKIYEVACAFDIETSSFIEKDYEYEAELSDIKNTKNEYTQSIYNIIKKNGGLKYKDIIHGLGNPLALDISRKWKGLINSKKSGAGMDIDLIVQILQYSGYTEFENSNDLLNWLWNMDTPARISKVDIGRYKRACMYIWQLGINGNVIIGRTWNELMYVFNAIQEHLNLSINKILRIYVHNLSFEFQFIRKRFEWEKVFAVESRYPVSALTKKGIEFRCSMLLSGYSLANLSNELQKYPVQKKTGDLDYSLIRHSGTPLTETELKYCENDVRVVMAYIQERIEIDGGISNIPYTKTGYVRKYCKNSTIYIDGNKKHINNEYREIIKHLIINGENEYKQLKRAFQGGFTHARAFHSCELLEHVASYDLTSSYPYVMIADLFPMSKAYEIKLNDENEFYKMIHSYACIFDVIFYGLRAIFPYENYISESKCIELEGEEVNNGRVVWAKKLSTTITEQDFAIIKKLYEWDKITIFNFRYYTKDYLPTPFVKSILKLYHDKTTLKGVAGHEIKLQVLKAMLNSTFGMTVTDICRNENIYSDNHEWKIEEPNYSEAIEKYNNKKYRFLSYVWGIYITAYARRNLFDAILHYQEDYIYSDTDSVKVLNYEKHTSYIEDYNQRCRIKLMRACAHHGIPFSMVEPSTIKGEKKLLGAWDFEGVYDKFKTLGAKRYMVEQSGKISITVSGVKKEYVVPYLENTYGHERVFEVFENELFIPAEATGKNTHTYIDFECKGTITDYIGNEGEYHELSSTHIEPAEYNLSISKEYLDYLLGVKTFEF